MRYQIQQSIASSGTEVSRRGNCWCNAAVERFLEVTKVNEYLKNATRRITKLSVISRLICANTVIDEDIVTTII
jgi:hypothetical protein